MSPSAVLLPDNGGRGVGGSRGGAWQKINGKWQTAPAPAQCEAGGAGSDNSSDNTEERSLDIQAQQTQSAAKQIENI